MATVAAAGFFVFAATYICDRSCYRLDCACHHFKIVLPPTCGQLCSAEFWASADATSVAGAIDSEREGASPIDGTGKTPLHWAAAYSPGQEAVKALIEEGVDVNARDNSGSTPLHEAAANNRNLGVVTALLDSGSAINVRAEDGKTPLHRAAEHSVSPDVVMALLDSGAHPAAKASDGTLPLDLASSNRVLKNSKAYRRLQDATAK